MPSSFESWTKIESGHREPINPATGGALQAGWQQPPPLPHGPWRSRAAHQFRTGAARSPVAQCRHLISHVTCPPPCERFHTSPVSQTHQPHRLGGHCRPQIREQQEREHDAAQNKFAFCFFYGFYFVYGGGCAGAGMLGQRHRRRGLQLDAVGSDVHGLLTHRDAAISGGCRTSSAR